MPVPVVSLPRETTWYVMDSRHLFREIDVRLIITVQAKWLKLLLNDGRSASNETVIPSVLLTAAATPYTVPYQSPSLSSTEDLVSPKTYGLAQEMYTYRGHYTIEHGGAVPGQMSQVARWPGLGLGVGVMVNDNEFGTGYHQVVQRRIVDTLAGFEKIDWASR